MKKAIPVLLVTFLILAIPLEATAQFGSFTEKGFGFGAGLSEADNSTSLGASAGYVFSPIAEAGLNISRTSGDNDINAVGIGPYAALFPVRQDEAFPVSIFLDGSYSFNSYSGDQVEEFESQGGDISGSTLSIGGGGFRTFKAGESTDVIPSVGVSYTRNKTEINLGGETQTETDGATSLGLSVTFLFKAPEATNISATPSISVSDGDTTFGVSAALIIPR